MAKKSAVKLKLYVGDQEVKPGETIKMTSIEDAKPAVEDAAKDATARAEVYLFPRSTRCPKCNAHGTMAYKTRDRKQYRRCRKPSCRHAFVVDAVLV